MAARRFDGFFLPFGHVFALLRVVPELSASFFGALVGEEFFAIEGSHAN